MQAKDVIKLFDHHRHDRMNELQLLMAYAKMGKMDNIKEKLQELVKAAAHERKLSNLEIPETALWIMTFNWRYSNLRMQYEVELDNQQLSMYDKKTLQLCRRFVEVIDRYAVLYTMYTIYLSFKEAQQKEAAATVEILCEGQFDDPVQVEKQLNLIDGLEEVFVKTENNVTVCKVSWQCRKTE